MPVKRLTDSLARLQYSFWKGRRVRRPRRPVTRTPHQKAQSAAMYLLGSLIVGWLVLHTHLALLAPPPGVEPIPPAIDTDLPLAGERGKGAGGQVAHQTAPGSASLCDPFDSSCIANSIASWAANALLGAFRPLTDGILKDPADIIYQTPPTDSYRNPVIMNINAAFVGALDAALACLLLIGAYNVIWGHHLRMPHSSVTELLPRAILVVGAVHFNLVFLGLFVDFANELSLTVIHLASERMLTSVIAGLLTNTSLAGLLMVILVIVLGILVVVLLIQRVGTIALIALLLGVAPLGLACFLLPQTMRWGRLWLSTLSSALVTQVLQITTLGLGGMFLTGLGAVSLFHLDQGLANAFLAVGTMLLVLKIPGMLQTWALHPSGGYASDFTERSSGPGFSEEESSDPTGGSFTTASANVGSGGGITGVTDPGGSIGTGGGAAAGAAVGGGDEAATVMLLA